MVRPLIVGWAFTAPTGAFAWAIGHPWTMWEANVVALLAALLCALTDVRPASSKATP
jgi:hypothetical protein